MSKTTFLQKISKVLPEIVDAKDLIKIGLFKSRSHLTNMRREGRGIAFIRVGKALIKYPKDAVLEYISNNYHENTGS